MPAAERQPNHHGTLAHLPPFDQQLASMLNGAILKFLRNGDLSCMATDLLQAAEELLGTNGGLIFDLQIDNHPRLLASSPGDWSMPLLPNPQKGDAWHNGFPQAFWRLPIERGEHLLLNPAELDQQGLRDQLPESIHSLFALPLETDGTSIGALFLFNRDGGFDPTSCSEAESLGHSVALAIATARARIAQQQTEADLRQAQKMEALGQLAAGVAHDFNNMLTVINGYVSLVSRQLPEDNPHQEDLTTVLEAGQRAADLSRQLLAFSRRQMLQPQVLDLNERIDNLQKMLRRVIREDISFKVALSQPLPYIKVDTGQLEQILMNLVINARDAMPKGGELMITTGETTFDPDFLRTNPGAHPGHYVWFRVSDTGVGINPADQAKIFQPFFTTKRQGKGTGLGLATVYGIVKQSEGYITVDSKPGTGTCFTVYLPRTTDGPQLKEAASERPALCQLGKLMLVEDDPQVLHFATKALLTHGYEVIPAGDVELAEELFACHDQEIALLVTDMVMPTLSGPLLAKNLRRHQPDLQVLFLSGYGQVTFTNDFLQGEEGDFLAKPFTVDGLIKKVQDVLGQVEKRS